MPKLHSSSDEFVLDSQGKVFKTLIDESTIVRSFE